MKKKLVALLLMLVLLAGTVTGIVLSTGATDGEPFDPDTYDYDALYVDGAFIDFNALDKSAGDTVDTVLATSTKDESVTLTLGEVSAGASSEWAYGDGYLELPTGAIIQTNGSVLTPASEVGEKKSYTIEYIFGTVDKGLPRTRKSYTSAYGNYVYAYTGTVTSYQIADLKFTTYYMTDEGRETLKNLADSYQAAKKDSLLRADYTFTPNSQHAGEDEDGVLNYEQTTALISSYPSYYEFLTYDFTTVALSRVSKTVLWHNDTWKADIDFKPSSLELFRMNYGDTRKAAFVVSTTKTSETAFEEQVKIYTDLSQLLSSSRTMNKTPSSSFYLAKDVGTRV